MMIRIGNACAFWGDSPSAAAQLMEQQPDLDFLTLDYLAELTLSIMAAQKEKDPNMGYAHDFKDVIRSLIPCWKEGSKVKVITNAGGLNPKACAEACRKIFQEHNLPLKIGVVTGDDVKGCEEMDPGLQTANAYLGAEPIVEALSKGVDLVITGRVADVSLTVAPSIFHFGWKFDDYDPLAGATVAGHLIECGTQVTGGISTNWLSIPNKEIGYPFVEMHEDGTFVITKSKYAGGVVNEETVKEQLLYEIGDPDNFLTPDVTVSLNSLQLHKQEENRIYVTHFHGKAPTSTYKVSATKKEGYRTEAMLTIFGEHAHLKAKAAAEVILNRIRKLGHSIERHNIEVLGTCDAVPGVIMDPFQSDSLECVLRLSLASHTKESLECFAKEFASLVTCGPPGTTGYTTGRPKIRPQFSFFPCLIAKDAVIPKVEIL